jgi:late competence protein required for DNA uptake (superfamily II DNA/RNA helicase)
MEIRMFALLIFMYTLSLYGRQESISVSETEVRSSSEIIINGKRIVCCQCGKNACSVSCVNDEIKAYCRKCLKKQEKK